MQALKVIGLGLLFSFIGTIGYFLLGILIAVIRGPSTGHATAISAVVAGLIEATVGNPIFWLLIMVAFGLAFWFVRFRQRT